MQAIARSLRRIQMWRPTYLQAGALASLAALAIVFTGGGVMAGPGDQVSFDGWRYRLITDPDGTRRAHVEYDGATVAQLRRYVEINRGLARQLAAAGVQQLRDVQVSFRREMPLDQFRIWSSRTPLRIERFQLVVSRPGGGRATLGGPAEGANVVSLSRLQGGLKALAADGFTTVSGVMVVEGTLPTSAYDQLANDPAVFAVDVTRAFVAQEVAKTNPLLTAKNFTITISPVFARMDQLGLENFR